ncbi:MAG: hypothetical protein NDI66_02775 [Pseudomonas sp.]|nr:hypothetical protein [Pseudomonas sp.]
MRVSVSNFRSTLPRAALVALLVAGVAATSGCGWFRKGDKLYGPSADQRPLEVPPELDIAAAQAADGGSLASARQGGATPQAAAAMAVGFNAPGERDAVFAEVGKALAATPGVTVATQAQLLGVFDVAYEGSNFLVRVSAVEGGSYVSAVDPRGVPAGGEAPRKLIDALKAAIVK